MKIHPERPALKARDIFRMIVNGKLVVETIGISGLCSFRLIEGRHIYQSWLSQTTGNITKTHASTYLRKGLFLIPIWQKVPNWQMEYYENHKKDRAKDIICSFENKWYRACYMQVEDIDHAIRQQKHITANYPAINSAFLSDNDIANRITEILRQISKRQITFVYIKLSTQDKLRKYRESLRSIIDYSPLFVSHDTSNKETVLHTIQRIADSCRSYDLCFRPIYRRLQRAALSLKCASKYIEHNHLKSARELIESALRNLEYPDPA